MNAELLKRIVRSHRDRDDESFTRAVEKLIESERKQGHTQLAKELSNILRNGHNQQLTRTTHGLTQVPRSKGDGLPLVEIRHPARSLQDIVLAKETGGAVQRILEEFAKREDLGAFGIEPKRKLLFFGPPGNGKTLCAEVLARELSLPLFYVRFDGLIASFLGETATNLRRVFDFAAQGLGILFFDEFDALGKSRDDHEDVGELKRVVNSFLQLLDTYEGQSPIIAATNYERLLDYALWRRFDAPVFFPQATEAQLSQYLSVRLGPFRLQDFGPDEAALWCKGASFSDAARTCTEAIKTMILTESGVLTASMFKHAVDVFQSSNRHRLAREVNPTGQN